MKFKIFILLVIVNITYCNSQMDKIFISATLNPKTKTISVKQKISFYNNTKYTLKSIFLHAAVNAYSNHNTSLYKRKLEDRNKILYFSKLKERGKINDLTMFIDTEKPEFSLKNFEFYEVILPQNLLPNQSIDIELNYNIKIPYDGVTGYGFSDDGDYLLKNFFLQPLNYKNGQPLLVPYTDTEFNPYRETEYDIVLYYPGKLNVESNLDYNINNKLKGISKDAVTILISQTKNKTFNYNIKGNLVNVSIGYHIDSIYYDTYKKYIKRELEFLNEKLNTLPKKIFLNEKIKKNANFIGIDDLSLLGVKKWKLFSDSTKIDLKMFQQIAYSTINQSITINKNKNHWIENGLITYYEYEYLSKYYSNQKLIGDLPNMISIFKFKPLNYFFISQVPLTERYKLGYRYIASQNYDQPISEDFVKYSNINQILISGFKTGLSFHFLSEYIGKENFEKSIRNLIDEKKDKEITSWDLQKKLQENSNKNLDWFFNNYIKTNDRINFKIKKFTPSSNPDSINIEIYNKTKLPVPILITGDKNDSIIYEKWVFSNKKDSKYSFPKNDYDQLLINRDYLFPEINDNDNILNTKGIFKNRKKIQLKFYSDVENPNYNQIFYEPKLKWNNYDKFILGFRFYNNSPTSSKPIEYSLSPTFSTGTKSLTGSAGINYNYDMVKGIFRRISIGTGYTFYHYDRNLSYTKYSGSLNFIFKKQPRSDINRNFSIAFNSVDREKDPTRPNNDNNFSHYNLLDLSYSHSDRKIINQWYTRTNFQHSNLFNKINTEIFFRHEYAYHKEITLRFFGGYFFNNDSNSDYFNYGIHHITDYGFGFSDYLGRSATNGLLYQQYILAEGGFKSLIDNSASKWISTLNTEIHLWKPLDVFVDLGVYRSVKTNPKFIYDSGIKLRVIPDFLELYFPIQSTLGFEPSMDNYLNRIRFIFNFNLAAVLSHIRRGWY